MRSSLILAIALLFTAGVAWAEEAPAGPVDDALLDGGGCVMPDLSGLSEEEAAAALQEAGISPSAVETAAPACPVTFMCSSITNCGITGACTVTDIGQCCTTGGGLVKCCISGTIKVRQCGCGCTGNPCNILCPQSTDVASRCA